MSDLIERLRCVDSIQKEIDVSIICEEAAQALRDKEAENKALRDALEGSASNEKMLWAFFQAVIDNNVEAVEGIKECLLGTTQPEGEALE